MSPEDFSIDFFVRELRCGWVGGVSGPVVLRNRHHSGPPTRPWETALAFTAAGLQNVEQDSVTRVMAFDDFADFWAPPPGKTDPVGFYLDSVDNCIRDELERRVRPAYEPGEGDGPRSFNGTPDCAAGRRRLEAVRQGYCPNRRSLLKFHAL